MAKQIKSLFIEILGNLSLKRYLSLILAVQLLVAVSITAYFSYTNSTNAVNNVVYQLQEEISQRVYQNIKEILRFPQDIVKGIIDVENSGLISFSDLDAWGTFFWHQIRQNQKLTGMGLATEDRDYVTLLRSKQHGLVLKKCNAATGYDLLSYRVNEKPSGEEEPFGKILDYDGRKRPQYRAGADAGRSSWSEFSAHLTSASLFTTFSHPVFDRNGELKGVAFGILFATHFSEFLQQQKVGKAGQIFLIEDSGNLIATSTGELPMKVQENKATRLHVRESRNALTRAAYQELSRKGMLDKGVEYHSAFNYQGQKHFINVLPLKDEYGLNWQIVVTVPQNDFMAVVKSGNRNTIIILLIFLLLSFLVAVLAARSLTRPLEKLSTSALAITEGNWEIPLDLNRQDEIGKLSQYFYRMTQQQRKLVDGLETTVQERTAELEQTNLKIEQKVIQRTADLKKALLDLRKSEELFKTIAMNTPDHILIQDWDLHYEYVLNPQLGLSEEDMIGKTDYDILTKEDADNLTKLKKRVLETGNTEFVKTPLVSPEGEINYFEGAYKPRRNEKEKIDGLIGYFKNITERVESENIIRQSEKEKLFLERQLKQAQKMESIGTLAGGIAHDFNNILGIIIGNTELALDDVPKWNSAHASLEEIKTASLRAKNIVKQLLSFSRKMDQELQPIQIGSVIKDALKFLRSTIPTTINIHPDIQTTDETILADPTQINQIIMNLCINAYHAMEQTGGELNVTVAKVILDDNSVREYPDLKSGDHVKIMISDTGPGIDPEIIDQIFDPYFTTKEVGKGSGMGLAVVHGIVKSYSGTIGVDSSQGKGTKFIILFPLTTEKPMVETKIAKDIPGGNETILFVDDEISIAKMVKRMFERLGYKVETATEPQDALERFVLNPDHFDLVITDMTMPQMTGVSLSEKLMDIRPDIPIIICTGHSALVDEEKAKELGLAAYVMKPISIRETAQTIRKVLDRK